MLFKATYRTISASTQQRGIIEYLTVLCWSMRVDFYQISTSVCSVRTIICLLNYMPYHTYLTVEVFMPCNNIGFLNEWMKLAHTFLRACLEQFIHALVHLLLQVDLFGQVWIMPFELGWHQIIAVRRLKELVLVLFQVNKSIIVNWTHWVWNQPPPPPKPLKSLNLQHGRLLNCDYKWPLFAGPGFLIIRLFKPKTKQMQITTKSTFPQRYALVAKCQGVCCMGWVMDLDAE